MHEMTSVWRGLAHRLARWPGTGMSHAAARRAWWLASDRAPGPWAAARLARHLGTCASCRAELDPVSIERTLRLVATPVVQPSASLTGALRVAAADALAGAVRAGRSERSDRWTRGFAGAAVAACAAGLLVAALIPRFGERPDELTRIDTRLDTIEADLRAAGDVARPPVLHATLDDELGGLESTIRCLRATQDDALWNLDIAGGDPCAES